MPEVERWDRAPQRQEADVWADGYAEAGADFAWDDNQYGGGAAGGYDEQGVGYGGGAQSAYGQNDYDPDGYGQNGYDPNDYDQNAYDPNAYDPNAYDPNGYDPDGYEYDYGAPPEADERSGGWRRLFGRR